MSLAQFDENHNYLYDPVKRERTNLCRVLFLHFLAVADTSQGCTTRLEQPGPVASYVRGRQIFLSGNRLFGTSKNEAAKPSLSSDFFKWILGI